MCETRDTAKIFKRKRLCPHQIEFQVERPIRPDILPGLPLCQENSARDEQTYLKEQLNIAKLKKVTAYASNREKEHETGTGHQQKRL